MWDMIPAAGGEAIVRLRRRLVEDPYSAQQTRGDWSSPDELPIPGAFWAPAGTTETEDAMRSQVTGLRDVFGPHGMDILPMDRVRFPDDPSTVWEVDGEVQRWKNPFSGDPMGSVARARKVSG
ncbi:hypothetical protein [Sinomonas sp. ASV322]|uniref:hypothetical protein n=1 Tax=Sinomonas sp. ASV322 TaxID=3041920 RepID=UPI0027DDCC20|nr:hypothetical protein [Sinomonas sp. ASV322]MDQ4502180.1 hypothetical protein [Sinomonas sp. ASV322]